MILLDVNILVYAHREDSPNHSRYRTWLESALSGPEPCAVSDLVLSGFMRIVTHPKVFNPPTPQSQALQFVEKLRSHPSIHTAVPGRQHWSIFIDLCRKLKARGNSIPDVYHAALAIETGCEWISTDAGFSRFPGLRWRHPLKDSC